MAFRFEGAVKFHLSCMSQDVLAANALILWWFFIQKKCSLGPKHESVCFLFSSGLLRTHLSDRTTSCIVGLSRASYATQLRMAFLKILEPLNSKGGTLLVLSCGTLVSRSIQ